MTIKKSTAAACGIILALTGSAQAGDGSWEVSIGALVLQRAMTDPVPLIVDTVGGGTLLSADQLDTDLNVGIKFSAEKPLSDTKSLAIEGFYTGRFGAPRIDTTPSAELTMYGAAFGTAPIELNYQSRLMGASATLRHEAREGSLTLLAGGGFLGLFEDMTVTDAGSPPNLFTGDLNNRLIGAQAGLEVTVIENETVELVGGGRLGAYVNIADFDAAFPQAGPAAVFEAGGTSFAGSAELWLNASIQVSDNTSLQFGYQGLLLGGVALLPEQLDDLAVPLLGTLDFGGMPIYHGVTAAIRTVW